MNDEELMASLRAGDNDALTILFERYHRLLFSIAFKILRDRGEAEDVTQIVFLEIFRSVAQFDPCKGTCKVWLLQFVYHRAINRKQHLNARHFYSEANIDDMDHVLLERSSGFGQFTQGELKHLIAQGLYTLNSTQRRVIELAGYEGLSMQEISDRTGETLSNVKHHYYRGLQKLREFVNGSSKSRSGSEQ